MSRLEKVRRLFGLREDQGYLNLDTHAGYRNRALL